MVLHAPEAAVTTNGHETPVDTSYAPLPFFAPMYSFAAEVAQVLANDGPPPSVVEIDVPRASVIVTVAGQEYDGAGAPTVSAGDVTLYVALAFVPLTAGEKPLHDHATLGADVNGEPASETVMAFVCA